MKAILITSKGQEEYPIRGIKSIAAVSQCNLLVTLVTGVQKQCSLVKYDYSKR